MPLRDEILNAEHTFFTKGNLFFSKNKKKEIFLYLSDKELRKILKTDTESRYSSNIVNLLENTTILKHEGRVRRIKI